MQTKYKPGNPNTCTQPIYWSMNPRFFPSSNGFDTNLKKRKTTIPDATQGVLPDYSNIIRGLLKQEVES